MVPLSTDSVAIAEIKACVTCNTLPAILRWNKSSSKCLGNAGGVGGAVVELRRERTIGVLKPMMILAELSKKARSIVLVAQTPPLGCLRLGPQHTHARKSRFPLEMYFGGIMARGHIGCLESVHTN